MVTEHELYALYGCFGRVVDLNLFKPFNNSRSSKVRQSDSDRSVKSQFPTSIETVLLHWLLV
jgi:hypothetical protein